VTTRYNDKHVGVEKVVLGREREQATSAWLPGGTDQVVEQHELCERVERLNHRATTPI
jgi:hypothetical protein